jgi:hypothetical protein
MSRGLCHLQRNSHRAGALLLFTIYFHLVGKKWRVAEEVVAIEISSGDGISLA